MVGLNFYNAVLQDILMLNVVLTFYNVVFQKCLILSLNFIM